MMLIGDKDGFAIDYEVDTPVDRQWLFGRLCFRVNGIAVGDCSEACSPMAACASFEAVLSREGHRQDDRLIRLPAADAFAEINAALFVDDSRSDAEIERDSNRYSRFLAVPGLDVFDYWMVFLIEDETRARLIWNRLPYSQNPGEAWLRKGTFDQTVKDCLRDISELAERWR